MAAERRRPAGGTRPAMRVWVVSNGDQPDGSAAAERSERVRLRREPTYEAVRAVFAEHVGAGADAAPIRLSRRCRACGSSEHGMLIASHADGRAALGVSLSRSAHLAAFTLFGLREPIGLDIEAVWDIGAGSRWREAAPEVLAPREFDALRGVPVPARADMLARLWAGKEAYGKAVGLGLGFDLRSVDMSRVTAGWWSELSGAQTRMWVRGLDLAVGFAAAIAAPYPRPVEIVRVGDGSHGRSTG